jgi:hypothetical protein
MGLETGFRQRLGQAGDATGNATRTRITIWTFKREDMELHLELLTALPQVAVCLLTSPAAQERQEA